MKSVGHKNMVRIMLLGPSILGFNTFDYTVEERAFVSFTNRLLCQFNKILDCFGDCFPKQAYLNTSHSFTTDFNIKPYLVIVLINIIFKKLQSRFLLTEQNESVMCLLCQ